MYLYYWTGGDFMPHPLQDQTVAFVGRLTRCSRTQAMDALYEVGGVPVERANNLARYLVAGTGAENTGAFTEFARYRANDILTEDQFFDILEGKALPPVRKKNPKVIIIPAKDPVADQAYEDELKRAVIESKRIAYLRKRGIPTENGRTKIDLRPAMTLKYVLDKIRKDPVD
jgi:hypothetical protein